MVTTLGSVDESEELERLRERAYGPDADIAQDAAAQARLFELEAARRRSTTLPAAPAEDTDLRTRTLQHAAQPTPATAPHPSDDAELHSRRFTDGAPPSEPTEAGSPVDTLAFQGSADLTPGPHTAIAGPSTAGASVGEPTPMPRDRWWRRRRSLAAIASGIAALVILVAIFAALTPRPDYVLHLQGVAGEEQNVADSSGSIGWLGLDADQLLTYEDFRGFRVWSGVTSYGTNCLLVSRADQGLATVGCSPSGMQTIADLQRYSGITDDVFADMPTGSVIRFVLNGDRVDVFLGEAEPVA